MATVEIRNVRKAFGSVEVLHGVSVDMADGEFVVLVGPSGCGKSTLLRMLAGLENITAGEIAIGGKVVNAVPTKDRDIAMVFQSYALYPHLSVLGNLELGLEVRGVPAAERRQRIAEVLALLQLEGLELRRPAQLSGGQRQRVALARALLRQPRLMLLDEPMSNLDAQLRDQLRPELRALLHRAGHPVIHVTHDQQEAMGLADRIAVLNGGVLQQVGTPQELYHRPANLFVARFLGRPGINLLAADGGMQLGIRPEHIRLVESGGLPARLLRREWQGAQQLLWLDTSRGELLLLTDAALHPPDSLQVSWRPQDELRFSSSSGERLD